MGFFKYQMQYKIKGRETSKKLRNMTIKKERTSQLDKKRQGLQVTVKV